ncbi:hypothetical protein SAMN05421753_11573 [Planctomicrobium piriforme]|uniref:Uncharacterized protein n=2 Tax=Planctomicrobium piriforme TaxID=1576369 RepID=A0A1I3NEB2_9PLAN|nr:hypothetical protein SAMN05421753_11573 [Planctomicrobium piriforme]
MYETTFDGIRFIEGHPDNAHLLEPIQIGIGGVFASAQMKNLDDVKRMMAAKAKAVGGNAVVQFAYGQKSAGFLASLFSRDDVNWYGNGQIARV